MVSPPVPPVALCPPLFPTPAAHTHALPSLPASGPPQHHAIVFAASVALFCCQRANTWCHPSLANNCLERLQYSIIFHLGSSTCDFFFASLFLFSALGFAPAFVMRMLTETAPSCRLPPRPFFAKRIDLPAAPLFAAAAADTPRSAFPAFLPSSRQLLSLTKASSSVDSSALPRRACAPLSHTLCGHSLAIGNRSQWPISTMSISTP